jgi:acyl-CoA thioester hydrolase
LPRVKLIEQPTYEFSYHTTLMPRDINYGGHLGNDAIVTLFGNARASMYHAMGFGEGDLGDGENGTIMSDLVVNYKAEGFVFDEIRIDSHIGELAAGNFRIFQRIVRNETLIALSETGIIVFNYSQHKIGRLPDVFTAKLQEVQDNT